MLDNNVFDVLHGRKFTQNTNVSAVPVDQKVSARDRHILVPNGVRNSIKADVEVLHFLKVNSNFNFFIVDPAQVHGCDGGNVFNFLLEVGGIVLKLVRGEFSRQIDVHNGLKLRDV